jgi:hypothetical protein
VHPGRILPIKSPVATLAGVMVSGVHTRPESCKTVYLIASLYNLSFRIENYEPYLLGGLSR